MEKRQRARAGHSSSQEEKYENFIAAVIKREMLAATKVKMSGGEKSEQGHIQSFLQKTCN